jgi:hypothetical protein
MAILIDYNGIALGAILSQKVDTDEDLIRHLILNNIRKYNKMFRREYGQVVIACEGGSWRKDHFPQYKAKRKKSRKEDDRDWDTLFKIVNKVTKEIEENLPYKVIKVKGAEADDIIGAIVEESQEFGKHEDIIVVSADKDFIQLQKYPNVKQYSPMFSKFITDPNPRMYLVEHIFKGDSGDGIPNVFSGDNVFVEGTRQTPMSKVKLHALLDNIESLETFMEPEVYRNYCRNKKMIDLSEMPSSIKEEVINTYENKKVASKTKALDYFIKNRMKMLIECIEEFY